MSKTIAELLEDVSKSKVVLQKAQEAYSLAKKALAESPLLAEAGLQVISDTPNRTRKPVSEETKQKMRDAWAKRQKKSK